MTLEERSEQFEEEFLKTKDKSEIKNLVWKLLLDYKLLLQDKYIEAHHNPYFKGYKMSYIFNDKQQKS